MAKARPKFAHGLIDTASARSSYTKSWAHIVQRTSARALSSSIQSSSNHEHSQNRFAFWTLAGLTFGGCTWLATTPNTVNCEQNSDNDKNPFFTAVLRNDLISIRSLSSDVNMRSPLGWCAVHYAAITSNEEMLKLLINLGADVNAVDRFDQYRMYIASFFGENSKPIDDARQWFERKDLRQASTVGCTPLHYACILGDKKIAKLLVENGADPLIACRAGLPVDLAQPDVASELRVIIENARETYLQLKQDQERELRRKYPLEDELRRNIVGQEGPIKAVAAAVRRRQNGWQDREHPLVFLFLGSSGIGKTELSKHLAKYLHPNNENGFIRIDMSEFQEKHSVAKFIGSPPGYVGYNEGGQLTEKLRKCPNAVVLLDEVEKAHPDVLTIMLQLFDEGRLTDGKGQTVMCKDAIFIMTSNLAQREIGDEGQALRDEAEKKQVGLLQKPTDEGTALSTSFITDTINPILRRHFQRDEFLGRINEILFFLPFNRQELIALTKRELDAWAKKALQRHDIILTWDDDVLDNIIEHFNMRYGARWIKHEGKKDKTKTDNKELKIFGYFVRPDHCAIVDRRIINQIAKAHEQDQVNKGGKVHVSVSHNQIVLTCKKGEEKKKSSSLFF